MEYFLVSVLNYFTWPSVKGIFHCFRTQLLYVAFCKSNISLFQGSITDFRALFTFRALITPGNRALRTAGRALLTPRALSAWGLGPATSCYNPICHRTNDAEFPFFWHLFRLPNFYNQLM